MNLSVDQFFDLSEFEHAALFDGLTHVWDAIPKIGAYIRGRFEADLQANGSTYSLPPTSILRDEDLIFIGEGTTIEPGVYIEGPAIIGRNCELRHGAYLRENVILGDGAIIGNSTELKNAVLMNHASAPHFAYVGDSLLGNRINLGAGTKLSNLAVTSKKDQESGKRPTIVLSIDGDKVDTGLTKFGAVLGDDVQLGCNCVTNPGCVIAPRTLVYALTSLPKGYYPADSIIKMRQPIEIVPRT